MRESGLDSASPLTPGGLGERTLKGLHEALVTRLAGVPRAEAVLDIGCGTGAWMERLGAAGFTDLTGIDRDQAGFRGRVGKHIVADLDHGPNLDLGKAKFGLITAIEVIEHLENPGQLLSIVGSRLSTNGYFLLTTPNIQSVNARLKFLLTGRLRQFDEKGDPTHIFPVLLLALERMLPRHGLYIDSRWAYPQAGTANSRWIVGLVAEVMRHLLPEAVPGDLMCCLIRRSPRNH